MTPGNRRFVKNASRAWSALVRTCLRALPTSTLAPDRGLHVGTDRYGKKGERAGERITQRQSAWIGNMPVCSEFTLGQKPPGGAHGTRGTGEPRPRNGHDAAGDVRLVPFLMLCYFIAFVDRVNAGFAAFQMNKDVGLSPSVFGLGGGIFFLAYFLFEVPSNLALEKVGARIWIARIMITWGLISGGHGIRRRARIRFMSCAFCSARPRPGSSPASSSI